MTPAPDTAHPAESHHDRPRMGLTLSGGGFRATLFHLGVVRFLYEEKLLPKVTHICSVSGGSILAAHLVLNWERYTSAKAEEFDAAARELVEFIRSDLRGRVVRPWLFSWAALGLPRLRKGRWWRNRLLQREYDRLYRGARLGDLASGDRPQLHLLSTSFTTGHLVAFGNNEMRFCGDPTPDPDSMPANEVPVALAVAASSAFPPLFPPVRVDHATFGATPDLFRDRHYLTDGGVFDNLGIRRLLWLFKPEERLDMVVVSDAQRSLAREYGNEYNLTLGRTTRCVDLMMNRVSWFESCSAREVIGRVKGQLLYCGLPKLAADAIRGGYAPSPPEQFAVSTARTDLDAFTDDEIDAIVHQGYAAARCAAEAGGLCGAWDADRRVWHPARPDRGHGYQLAGIDRRKSGLFRAGHWATWGLWGLMALWVAIPLGVLLYQSYRAEQGRIATAAAEANAADQERQRKEAEAKAAAELKAAEDRRLRDERERQRQIDHATKKIKIVRMLGDVVISGNPESAERRLKEWHKFADELRKDAWFAWYLDDEDTKLKPVEEALEKPWPYPAGTEQRLLDLAKELRSYMQGSDFYLQVLRQNREQWYGEVGEAIEQIANPQKVRLIDVPNSRRQFWRLYWGPMVLVEGAGVERAMAKFGEILREWERGSKDDKEPAPPGMKDRLKGAADEVREACAKELKSM